jgi:hypothetical protein
MRRRRLIAATGTVVTALLAGCGSPGGEGDDREGGGTGGETGGDGEEARGAPNQFGP